MRFVITFAGFFCFLIATAQDHNTCNGERYRTATFSEVDIVSDIRYGDGVTIAGDSQELFMDVYTPKGDVENNRPVIVLAFGGSFLTGTKTDIDWLCEDYAKRGFVAVSIDYRLYDLPVIPFPNASEMQTVVVKSLVDMNNALQFLLDDAAANNIYGIDTNMIFVGGISSGSIMACHTAMLDSTDNIPSYITNKFIQEGVVDQGKNLLGSKTIKGVVNFSGGLHIGDWYDNSDPPVFSYHDDGDATVPYKKGWAQVFGQNIVELEGSFVLDSLAKERGMISELHTIENSPAHVGYFFDLATTVKAVDESAKFLYKLMCSDLAGVNELDEMVDFGISPNPFIDGLSIDPKTASNYSVVLSDSKGVVMLEKKMNNGRIVLRTDGLTSGVYFLSIEINGKVNIQKVVKE